MKKVLLILVLLISLPALAEPIENKGMIEDINFAINMTCHSKNRFNIPNREDSDLCMKAYTAKLQIQILEELQKLNAEKPKSL